MLFCVSQSLLSTVPADEWLGEDVNVTRSPLLTVYDADDVSSGTYDPKSRDAWFADPRNAGGRKYITYYESVVARKCASNDDTCTSELEETSIWEIEGVGHREIIQDSFFLDFTSDIISDMVGETTDKKKKIIEHRAKTPKNDHECAWSYRLLQCVPAQHCHYAYRFGDLTVSTSCRLRGSSHNSEDEVTMEDGDSDGENPCDCLYDMECPSGFCRYKSSECPLGRRAFGPEHGSWGPCQSSAGNFHSQHARTKPDGANVLDDGNLAATGVPGEPGLDVSEM